MARDIDPYAMSELEREFELEMDEPGGVAGSELEADLEALFEQDEPVGEYEYEYADEGEYESFDDTAQYAQRFYELSEREFESESEADQAISGLLTEMEADYFWKSIGNAVRRGVKKARSVSGSPLGGLIRKGLAAAGGQIPALQALRGITQLARGDMRGLLGSLAKAGLGAALPGAGAFLPGALKVLGFETGQDPEENREAWENFTMVSREAYENLANNLNERADDPLEASRLATRSFQQALQGAPRARRRPGGIGVAAIGAGARVVYLQPGEALVVRAGRQ